MPCSPPWRGARSLPGCAATGGDWLLELEGDAPAPFDPRDARPGARARPATTAQRIVIAPSSPLGIEWLPEAEPLLDDYHRGVLELGAPFELWGGLVLADPSPSACARCSTRAPSVSPCPRARSAGPRASRGSARRWRRSATRPLFIHPGPAAGSPAWFPALTAYVAEMSTAWHAWAQWGRPAHPRLKVVFAMLAGLAPLHAERLAARGGPAEAVHDPLTAFDTSSYGPRAIDAMLRVVGVDRLLYGSDRPVVEPIALTSLGAAAEHAIVVTNPERFV